MTTRKLLSFSHAWSLQATVRPPQSTFSRSSVRREEGETGFQEAFLIPPDGPPPGRAGFAQLSQERAPALAVLLSAGCPVASCQGPTFHSRHGRRCNAVPVSPWQPVLSKASVVNRPSQQGRR